VFAAGHGTGGAHIPTKATARRNKPKEQRPMAEYFIFLSTCIGLTLSLIGLWLWLDGSSTPELVKGHGHRDSSAQ
jgi:hypothetical protein